MPAQIIDGKAVAARVRERVAAEVRELVERARNAAERVVVDGLRG